MQIHAISFVLGIVAGAVVTILALLLEVWAVAKIEREAKNNQNR